MKKQFSLTRAALSTGGCAKTKFLSVRRSGQPRKLHQVLPGPALSLTTSVLMLSIALLAVRAHAQGGCYWFAMSDGIETESTGGQTMASDLYPGVGIRLGNGGGPVGAEGWAVYNIPLTDSIGTRATSYTALYPRFFGQDTSWYPNGGPNMYIWNWQTSAWDSVAQNVGKPEGTYPSPAVGVDSSWGKYIHASGRNIKIKILAGTYDDTQVRHLSVQYYAIVPPYTPTGVSATDGSYCGIARVTWNPDTLDGPVTYEVWRNIAGGGTSTATRIASGLTTTTYDDTPPIAAQTYAYWVKTAGNCGSISAFSSSDNGYAKTTPSAPTGVTASDGTYCNFVRISWNTISSATAYELYRDGGKVGDPATSTFDDYPGDTFAHSYTVKAKNNCGTSGAGGPDSGWANITPPTPTGVSATDGSYCAVVRVTWNPATRATAYEVYRDGSKVGDPLLESFDDYPGDGSNHSYTVKAKSNCGTSGASTANSGYALTAPPAPTGLSATDGIYCQIVRLSWSSAAGATGYEIYRDGNKVTDAVASPADDSTGDALTHSYTVKAKNACGVGSPSTPDTGYAAQPPAPPTTVSASDGTYADHVSANWGSTASATGYEVWRNTSNNSGSAGRLGTSSGTTYNDFAATACTTYWYWIKATNSCGGSGFSPSDSGVAGSVPAAPGSVTASDGTYTDRVRVTWNLVSGASGYEIWRASSNNSGSATTIGGSPSTPFDDLGGIPGVTNYYWVKAMNSCGASGLSVSDSGYVQPTGPVIARSPASLTNTIPQGQNAARQAFQVWNSGSSSLNYTISSNASWLSVAPATGTSSGAANAHSITYSSSDLAPGPYSGTLTISDPGAGNSPQTIAVSLTVTSTNIGSIFADFSTPATTLANMSVTSITNFAYNSTYGASWLIQQPGGGFSATFTVPQPGDYEIFVTHLSSASASCQGGGYSPVNIFANGTQIASNFDPASNHAGSHGFVTDVWRVPAFAGQNILQWIAGSFCTYYWIQRVEIRPARWNDNFADRIALNGYLASPTGQNTNATKESGEPNHGGNSGGRSVWWTWTAPAAGIAVITTAGSSFDTTLGVYTGNAVGALTTISGNDDDPLGGFTSRVTFNAVVGTSYQIAVDGYAASRGRIAVNLTLIPGNDAFANRFALNGYDIPTSGFNYNATKEALEPNHAGSTGGRSVWWSWVAPISGTVRITTASSTFDTILGLYTSSAVSNLVTVASNDDENYGAGIWTSLVVTDVLAGTEYKIAVDGFGGAAGQISLNVFMDVPFLRAAINGNQMVLCWRTNWVGYNLESCGSFGSPASWSQVSPPPVTVGTFNMVSNTISGSSVFYRLRHP